jgi:hypothetical protein
MTERVVIPGLNHDAEIRGIEESVSELDAAFERGEGSGGGVQPDAGPA